MGPQPPLPLRTRAVQAAASLWVSPGHQGEVLRDLAGQGLGQPSTSRQCRVRLQPREYCLPASLPLPFYPTPSCRSCGACETSALVESKHRVGPQALPLPGFSLSLSFFCRCKWTCQCRVWLPVCKTLP